MELTENRNIEIYNLGNDVGNPYREYLAIDQDGNLWITNDGQGCSLPTRVDEDIMKDLDHDRIEKMLESAIQAGWTEAAAWIKDFIN